MTRPKMTVNNASVNYCKGCATYTAEVIEETESHLTTLCGVCGRIRQRRREHGQD